MPFLIAFFRHQFLALIVVLVAGMCQSQAHQYVVTDLGTLSGTTLSMGLSVNSRGNSGCSTGQLDHQ